MQGSQGDSLARRSQGEPGSRFGLRRSPPPRRGRARLSYLLLLVPFVALLWVPFYAKLHPELFGFPFFYWYQFVWVPLAALVTWIVYAATRSDR